MQHRVRGGFCSSCPASWKQMSEAEAVFHGCFKAFPGSSQFVCQDEIKAGTSWHIVVCRAAAESALKSDSPHTCDTNLMFRNQQELEKPACSLEPHEYTAPNQTDFYLNARITTCQRRSDNNQGWHFPFVFVPDPNLCPWQLQICPFLINIYCQTTLIITLYFPTWYSCGMCWRYATTHVYNAHLLLLLTALN